MKKIVLIAAAIVFTLSSGMTMAQKKVSSGGMTLTVPSEYEVNNESGIIGFSLTITAEDAMYVFMELAGDFSTDYIMQNSILNNAVLSNAEWGEVEKCTFLSFQSQKVNFVMPVSDKGSMFGAALAFNGGNGRSYGIIMIKAYFFNILKDKVVNSLKIEKNVKPLESRYATTREEVAAFIDELRPNFGNAISMGVTMDNIELNPRKDILTFTFGIQLLSKSDLDGLSASERSEMVAEMKIGSVEAIQNLKTFSAMKRCMDEDYTFIIKYHDGDGEPLFSYSLTPEDYK